MQKNAGIARIVALATMAALGTGFAPLATAADASDLEQKFTAADKNADGKLTLAEAEAGMSRVAKNFSRIDKDGKGYVTLEQLKAAMDR
jgi:Ca2+-binding EF-hand superfamily protein